VFYRAVQGTRRIASPVYEAVRAVPCCAEMNRQWERFVCFGAHGHRCSTDRSVTIFTARPQTNGKMVQEVAAIAFCPWCGAAVVPVRVK
jgi:hypothetical protein